MSSQPASSYPLEVQRGCSLSFVYNVSNAYPIDKICGQIRDLFKRSWNCVRSTVLIEIIEVLWRVWEDFKHLFMFLHEVLIPWDFAWEHFCNYLLRKFECTFKIDDATFVLDLPTNKVRCIITNLLISQALNVCFIVCDLNNVLVLCLISF